MEQMAKALRSDKIKKLGLKVVEKGLPKLGAVMGGPIGMGIAAASTMMDVNDAYALGESTMNPTTAEDLERQLRLAQLFRNPEMDRP